MSPLGIRKIPRLQAIGDHFSIMCGVQFYRTTSHTRNDVKLHFVWITKYRRPMLTEEVALRVRELVREICLAKEVQILLIMVGIGIGGLRLC